MKRMLALCIVCIVCAQATMAAPKDSILALTGGARTKLVWLRWPWCDSSYTPIQAYKSGQFEQEHNFTQVIAYDTDEGKYRFLDSIVGSHCFPKLTRKDGSHVIWNDRVNNCSWIRDFAGTQPKRKLIDGGDYYVAACQYSPATQTEFVYVLGGITASSTFGTSCSRIPLKADHTVDMTQKFTIPVSGQIDWHVSASQDGKYLGMEIPWPHCMIVEAATGAQNERVGGSEGACQPNIAPDNSYRFYHLLEDHTNLVMWQPNLSTTSNWVYLKDALPYCTDDDNSCSTPRWSNDIRYFTIGYPHDYAFYSLNLCSDIFTLTAAQVKQRDPQQAGTFLLGKFKADFSAVEKAVVVSDRDIRHREVIGDAWVAPAGTAIGRGRTAGRGTREIRMINRGDAMVISSNGRPMSFRLTDAQGRVVFRKQGAEARIDTKKLIRGVYALTANAENGGVHERFINR